MTFIGYRNYLAQTQDPIMQQSFINTMIIGIWTIITATLLGLAGAVIVARRKHKQIFIASYYLPAVLSLPIVGMIWGWIFSNEWGLLNWMLRGIGLSILIPSAGWLSINYALWAVCVVNTWGYVPFTFVVFLAALQAIPFELYEAAMVDGASARRQFTRITLPGLKYAFVIILTIELIDSFKAFALPFILTAGGPAHATEVLASYMFLKAFTHNAMGYAASISVFILAFVLVLTALYLWVSRERM
jgi:raffinose/stachyose/melibiose transport system permease protein